MNAIPSFLEDSYKLTFFSSLADPLSSRTRDPFRVCTIGEGVTRCCSMSAEAASGATMALGFSRDEGRRREVFSIRRDSGTAV
jgi:hypothetical protein